MKIEFDTYTDAKIGNRRERLSDDNIDNNNNNRQKYSFLFDLDLRMRVCLRTEQY